MDFVRCFVKYCLHGILHAHQNYFIDHVLHIINFIETLYIYYVFPDVVLTIWHVEHFLNYCF